jgi:hypothetical protein
MWRSTRKAAHQDEAQNGIRSRRFRKLGPEGKEVARKALQVKEM